MLKTLGPLIRWILSISLGIVISLTIAYSFSWGPTAVYAGAAISLPLLLVLAVDAWAKRRE